MSMDKPATFQQKFRRQLTRLYSNLIIAPCLLCGQAAKDGYLCPACLTSLPDFIQACPRCAKPSMTNTLCGNCLHNPPIRVTTHCLYSYEPPIDRLIADFKFHDKVFLSRFFAQQLADKIIARNQPLPTLLIPIPLHQNRLKQRGYNQAKELSQQLSSLLTIPYSSDALSRIRDTEPQSGLPLPLRHKNVQHAFKVNQKPLPTHVALIDDVLTTGHTAETAAKILSTQGATHIELWTIARTIRHY